MIIGDYRYRPIWKNRDRSPTTYEEMRLSSILIYWKLINLRLEKLMCEKLWKWKIFMHFLTLFYVSVLNRYRPIMQLSYRYRHRYRPIWKSDISVVIGIGRYEKMLIGRPLLCNLSIVHIFCKILFLSDIYIITYWINWLWYT